MYYIYMLRCKDDSIYTGITTDLDRRMKEHFGEAAEPLYPRIVKYFQILESYHFISFKNMEK